MEKIPEKQEEVEEQLNELGLDFDKFSAEFSESGALSEESYEELAAKGLPKEMVDAYIEGQKVIAERNINSVHEAAGGKEQYSELIKFASENYTPEQIDKFNETIDSGDTEAMKTQILALKQVFTETNGNPPQNLIDGDLNQTDSTGRFNSMNELIAAQRDPRYGKDMVYTKEVEDKMLRSSNLL